MICVGEERITFTIREAIELLQKGKRLLKPISLNVLRNSFEILGKEDLKVLGLAGIETLGLSNLFEIGGLLADCPTEVVVQDRGTRRGM